MAGAAAEYDYTPIFGRADTRLSKTESAVDPRLDEARTEPDLEKRIALLTPVTQDPKLAIARAARVELVHALARLGRVDEMERAARELEIADDREGADLLDAMAYATAEHGGDRDRALLLARRAVDIAVMLKNAGPRKGEARSTWKRELELRKARHRDTLGWALFKGGDEERAIDELRDAEDDLPDDVRVQWHLGSALAEAGRKSAAIDALAKAVAGDEADSPRARELLQKLAPDADAHIARATRSLASRVGRRATADPLDEVAPPLTSVRLEEGPAIVLFWASWDEPSLHALRALTALQKDPAIGGHFRIVSVALDRAANGPHVATFGVPFPVGLDPERADARAWRARTLPTSVVLDARGRVRYRNEGMTPGYQWVLKAQAESLGGT